MKKDLLTLVLLVGLTSVVAAQESIQFMPVGEPLAMPVPEAAEAAEPVVAPPCAVPCDPCCTPLKKVCCPAPAKKTKTHVEYGHKCEDFCLPACGLKCLFSSKKGCESCDDCIKCGKPMERKKLVKKVRKEECDEMKCEVNWVPDCEPCKVKKCKAAPCCPVSCDPCVPAPCTTVVVPAPVQPMPLPK